MESGRIADAQLRHDEKMKLKKKMAKGFIGACGAGSPIDHSTIVGMRVSWSVLPLAGAFRACEFRVAL